MRNFENVCPMNEAKLKYVLSSDRTKCPQICIPYIRNIKNVKRPCPFKNVNLKRNCSFKKTAF